MFFRFVLTLAVLYLPQLHGLQNKTVVKKTIRSQYEKYLKGHVFKRTTGAEDPQHCLSDCWAENDRCQSFNYLVDLDECELNEESENTAPGDLVDKFNVVYLTNPVFGRKKRPQLPRHTLQQPSNSGPCASNPGANGGFCSPDEKRGFRCLGCSDGFYGQMCEEKKDPCLSQPCSNGAICSSTESSMTCSCSFPTVGELCDEVSTAYQFDFDGTNEFPTLYRGGSNYWRFSIPLWFKTKQNTTSYLMSFKPNDNTDPHVFSLWRNGSTFFLELFRGEIYNFSFPYSYPLHDDKWHSVVIGFRSGEVTFFLDGVMRSNEVHTGRSHYYFKGLLQLGYYEDSNGTAHYFRGSIGNIDLMETQITFSYILKYIIGSCNQPSRSSGAWSKLVWSGHHLARPVQDCGSRDWVQDFRPKYFVITSSLRWLEMAISPPRPLTAFTLTFINRGSNYPGTHGPFQMACYGADGANCALSVVIQTNMTLEIVIASTRIELDFLPIFDHCNHRVVITWSNQGGVLEVIVDDVLQSRVLDVETNGTIPGQDRFLVGGNDVELKNFVGHLTEFNVWDKLLPWDYLGKMTRYPGNDRGNLVAWKELNNAFNVRIKDSVEGLYEPRVNALRVRVEFNSRDKGTYLKTLTCCANSAALTFTIWVKLKELPAVLLSADPELLTRTSYDVLLAIDNNGTLTLSMFESELRIGSFQPSSLIDEWHFIAFTWERSGKVYSYLDGNYTLRSTTFRVGRVIHGHRIVWYIGSTSMSLLGSVTAANIWQTALPLAAIRAMWRGSNSVQSSASFACWEALYSGRKGEIKVFMSNDVYLPVYANQVKMDEFCNTENDPSACSGKYYARLGFNHGKEFGCFCEKELSHDLNFNFGQGNYTASARIAILAKQTL